MKTEIIGIKGMHCKSCANLIESRVGALAGVEKVQVDLVKNKAEVGFDQEAVSLERINQEIEAAGYKTGESRAWTKGLLYGLVPHIGCIAFLIGSVLGVTVLMQFFRPLLMNRYFFYILIGMSLFLATLSAAWYLRNNGLLSWQGAKRKWAYLTAMYGSTVAVNLLLFLVIFPLAANISVKAAPSAVTGNAVADSTATLQLQVDIPCSGHASLITSELKKIDGVLGVQFSLPNKFDVTYDAGKASKEQILALDVFKEYPARVVSAQLAAQPVAKTINTGSFGSSGSCGASAGGCGCKG
jgi:copper ion binding protein